MFTWFIERVFFAESPLVWFLGLVVITQLIYHYFFTQRLPEMLGSAVVIALGAVAVYVLPHFDAPLWLMTLLSLELMILWLYFAVNYMQAYAQEELVFPLRRDKLATGVWVMGTAVTGLLLEEADPLLYGCIIMLAMISLVLLVVYFYKTASTIYSLFCHSRSPMSGMMMLPALAVSMVLLLAIELFRDEMPYWVENIIFVLTTGYACLGLLRLMRYWSVARSTHLVAAWPTSNTLIYGVFATIGLAMVNAGSCSTAIIVSVWGLMLVCLVTVTTVEGLRTYVRVQAVGWMKTLTRYHPVAWFRIYALAMTEAFTYEVWQQTGTLNPVIAWISLYGHEVVSLLCLAQVIITLRAVVTWPK